MMFRHCLSETQRHIHIRLRMQQRHCGAMKIQQSTLKPPMSYMLLPLRTCIAGADHQAHIQVHQGSRTWIPQLQLTLRWTRAVHITFPPSSRLLLGDSAHLAPPLAAGASMLHACAYSQDVEFCLLNCTALPCRKTAQPI